MDEEKKLKIHEKIGNEIKSDKKFYIRLVVVALLLVVGYYAFSPYQKCKRLGYMDEYLCLKNTGW